VPGEQYKRAKTANMRTLNRAKVFFSLRLIFGIFLFIILARFIDLHQMSVILTSAQPQFIAAGFLVIMLNFLLKTYRWASILWIQESDISFGQIVRFNFISMFLANFLPGSISSDFVRFYQISKYTSQVRGAISSILVDRIIGIVSTAIATVIALVVLQQTDLVQMGSLLSYGMFGFLLLSVGVPLALQNSNVIAGTRRLLSRFTGKKLLRRAIDVYEDLLLYRDKPGLILKTLSLATLSLVIAAFEFYTVALGLSSGISIGYYLIFVPLAIFLAMLPISWGGIGVLEASMVFFFSKVGMPVEMCLSIVIVRRALFLLSTIPGGMLYMIEGFPARKLSI
jgi:glycosyltransferase 2 family protein